MSNKKPPPYIRHGVCFVSRRAWPTVNNYFDRKAIHPACRDSIEIALRKLGFPEYIVAAEPGFDGVRAK